MKVKMAHIVWLDYKRIDYAYYPKCSDVFGKIPFGEMLDKVKAYGIGAVEITTGSWGECILDLTPNRINFSLSIGGDFFFKSLAHTPPNCIKICKMDFVFDKE